MVVILTPHCFNGGWNPKAPLIQSPLIPCHIRVWFLRLRGLLAVMLQWRDEGGGFFATKKHVWWFFLSKTKWFVSTSLNIYMTIAIARPRATTRFLFLRQGSATDSERSHGKTIESTLPLFSIQKFYKEDLEDSHRIDTTPGAFDPNSRHFRRRTSELPEKYILGWRSWSKSKRTAFR